MIMSFPLSNQVLKDMAVLDPKLRQEVQSESVALLLSYHS